MNVDEEAVKKLLELFEKQKNQQVTKNCEPKEQVMAPVTGQWQSSTTVSASLADTCTQ